MEGAPDAVANVAALSVEEVAEIAIICLS